MIGVIKSVSLSSDETPLVMPRANAKRTYHLKNKNFMVEPIFLKLKLKNKKRAKNINAAKKASMVCVKNKTTKNIKIESKGIMKPNFSCLLYFKAKTLATSPKNAPRELICGLPPVAPSSSKIMEARCPK